MVHRMRAPPHGFSQLAASFLAYPRLGIPRAPLLRLTSSKCSLRSREQPEFDKKAREPLASPSIPTSAALIQTGPPVQFNLTALVSISRRSQSPELSNNDRRLRRLEAAVRFACFRLELTFAPSRA